VRIITSSPESTQQPASRTTGPVWSELLATIHRPPMLVNRTYFPPRARTCWHIHTNGQLLIVEKGIAFLQEEGGPIQAVGAGGIIVCDPGVRHWHGAAPNHTMTQFAITQADDNGEYAVWGENVTDQEYDNHSIDVKKL
jgi:quercetin dioxygenase-like cupin family protein